MTNRFSDFSLKTAAKTAGFGYLIIFICGIFANFFVLETLVVPGEASATAENILASQLLFRTGIVSFTVMVIFDLIVAWALYFLLLPVSRSLSLLSAWFRLVNAAVFGIALYHLLGVLEILSNGDYQTVFQTDQIHARVMIFLDSFNNTWLLGLIFFGFHLLILGYLIIKSGFIPKILGIFLIVASFGYLIDSYANCLLPNYTEYQNIFMMVVVIPGIIGELSFTAWLLLKGKKIPEIDSSNNSNK